MALQGRVRLDNLRQYHENERQWLGRREFLARHMHLYPGRKLEQLIALSMVWSNIVFIGNRYGEQLTEKVHKMGEGIDIGEMPCYELVPGATKRPSSSSADGQPPKKFGPRPRFEPVHFVASTVAEDKSLLEIKKKTDRQNLPGSFQTPDSEPQTSSMGITPSECSQAEDNVDMELDSCPYVFDPGATDEDDKKNDFGNFMNKMEQSYSAKFESHNSSLGKDFRSKILDSWKGINKQGRKGIGFVKPPKSSGRTRNDRQSGAHTSVGRASLPCDKSGFIRHLSSIVKQNMVNPQMTADNRHVNFTHVLSRSIQACKTNPEYIYVPIKDLHLESFPKFPKSQKFKMLRDGYACEVRCQDVYLATGYSLSKSRARDQAAELAIQLLQKPTVDVTSAKRKCGEGYRDDMAAFSADSDVANLPPILKQEEAPTNNDDLPGQQYSEETSSRPLSDFIIVENAADAIGILKNSATLNKMSVDYQYDMMPNHLWRCCVYVEDHYVAEGFGNKKNSKRVAAESAVTILKNLQPGIPSAPCDTPTVGDPSYELKNFVVYENSENPVCTLNDTAQFNQINIEYVFEKASGLNWRCKVFIEQKFIADAVGIKKTVKHEAAEAAVNALKKTHPVVVNSLKKGPIEAVISRKQIRGLSNDNAYKQQIKEDNIGNRLLRKMGWTGGGLGKEGEGIAEPITVKEQFRREGLGLMTTNQKITKRDIEQIIRNYAASCTQDDLTFSRELTNEERKQIHQMAQKYGLKSKSHGQGTQRFLVVSRKINRKDLLDKLRQDGQFGSYALVMPHN